LAKSLGLSVDSLQAVGIGWSSIHRAWSFPMRNAKGEVVGIRLRAPNGRKFSVTGGHEGLFLPVWCEWPTSQPLDGLWLGGNCRKDDGRLLICEGATDTAALVHLGFNALVGRPSCSGGSDMIVQLVRQQEPREVVIVADADEPGQQGAAALASVLIRHVTTVKALTPPAGIKDVRDWLRAGSTRERVEQAIAAASRVRCADRSPTLGPHSGPYSERARPTHLTHSGGSMTTTPVIQKLKDIPPTQTRWLWPDYIPRGKLTLIDGDPGLGKSFLSLELAARITGGRPFPVGEGSFETGRVLLITCEDSLSDIIAPRLIALGADLSRIYSFQGCLADGADYASPPLFPRDLPLLREVLDRFKPSLVVIDPLMAYIDLSFSSINDQAIRQVLAPMAQIGQEQDCAFLLIRHLNKSGGPKAIYRGSGSIGIVGSARISFVVGKHPADETARVLAPIKSNLGPMPLAVAWRLVNHPTLQMEWLGEVEYSADDLVGNSGEKKTALERAEAFLRNHLKDAPKSGDLIKQLARGIGLSERTLERAKTALGVQSRQVGPKQHPNAFEWYIPALFAEPEPVPELPSEPERQPGQEG
jgi:5S rRNA maturation endonuclease (ribonuclease M5)